MQIFGFFFCFCEVYSNEPGSSSGPQGSQSPFFLGSSKTLLLTLRSSPQEMPHYTSPSGMPGKEISPLREAKQEGPKGLGPHLTSGTPRSRKGGGTCPAGLSGRSVAEPRRKPDLPAQPRASSTSSRGSLPYHSLCSEFPVTTMFFKQNQV